ncbi:MAG: hypothetical protein ABEJ06_02550 [Haloarculaceae archaeon]
MATESAHPVVRLPAHRVAYVAVIAALVSAAIHLLLAPRVMGFNRVTGVLFYLNGLGWLGGIGLFFSRFWWRDLYLVAAIYALTTIIAFVTMSGRTSSLALTAKAAEMVVVFVSLYLWTTEHPDERGV